MKKTKKDYEVYLNELYADTIRDYEHAQEQLGYLAKTKRKLFGNNIHPTIITAYNSGKLGTLLRKNDTIAFHVGYNDWLNME